MSRLGGHSFNDAPHIVAHQIQIWIVETRIPWTKTYYPTTSFEPQRAFIELFT